MAMLRTIAVALAMIPVLPFVLIFFLQLGLRLLGWYLQSQTQERRAAITAACADGKPNAPRSEISEETEDGWEKIEKTGTAVNGKPEQNGWSGIIGFFHPFW
jgi:flagellar biosynthesis component FlhA